MRRQTKDWLTFLAFMLAVAFTLAAMTAPRWVRPAMAGTRSLRSSEGDLRLFHSGAGDPFLGPEPGGPSGAKRQRILGRPPKPLPRPDPDTRGIGEPSLMLKCTVGRYGRLEQVRAPHLLPDEADAGDDRDVPLSIAHRRRSLWPAIASLSFLIPLFGLLFVDGGRLVNCFVRGSSIAYGTAIPQLTSRWARPASFWNNSVRNNWLFLKFLFTSHSRKNSTTLRSSRMVPFMHSFPWSSTSSSF